MERKNHLIYKAEFNPRIKTYLLTSGSLIFAATIVGIVLIPFWLLLGNWYIEKYIQHLECELTSRTLRFKKGFLFQTERTIPLDKIQDLTFKEGPLLKHFGLSILSVETAGNASAQGADLSLIGIVDAFEFRSKVLDQRDIVTENIHHSSTEHDKEPSTLVLEEIRDSLKRIEHHLTHK